MSHFDSIKQAIDNAGPLTRAELLEVTGIKDTVLDATMSKARTRGLLYRAEDGRWHTGETTDDDQVLAATKPATTSTPAVTASIREPVVKPTASAAPAQQERAVTTITEHLVQCGRLRIVVSGVGADDAGPILAAALQAAVEVYRR